MVRILIFIFALLVSCRRNNELPREIRSGVNGDAVYITKDDSTVFVVKKEYDLPDYRIMINNDTILLGSYFGSYIHVVKKNWKVTIDSPSDSIILSDGNFNSQWYSFKPKNEGLFEYRGTIEYDSLNVPFEYKFVVIRK